MKLEEKIRNDLKDAMRAKNELVLVVLRSLISEIQSKEIELKKKEEGLRDSEIEQIVLKELKKRQDARDQFKKGGRDDLADNEMRETEILQNYAPEMMGEDELKKIIDDTINEIGADRMEDIGRTMSEVMKRAGSNADGSLVNKLVREKLNG